jgi:hypothetical protein
LIKRYQDFKASNGYIEKFKKRMKITRRAINTLIKKDYDEQKTKIIDFLFKFDNNIKENNVKLLFNFDETAVFFETQPKCTLDIKGVKHVGVRSFGKSKQRLTAICGLCSNGVKLPLIIIVKSQAIDQDCEVKKGTFDDLTSELIRQSNTLVLQNRKAWCNAILMRDHVLPHFKRFLPKRINLLYLMDNCSAHSCDSMLEHYEEEKLNYMFLPPETTPMLQPFDVAMAKAFKSRIRQRFQEHLQDNLIDVTYDSGKKKKSFNNPTRDSVVRWAIESWQTIDTEANSSIKGILNYFSIFKIILGIFFCGSKLL